jgi:hypothetical protein
MKLALLIFALAGATPLSWGETLSFRSLKANEGIVMYYRVEWDRGGVDLVLQTEAGDRSRMKIIANPSSGKVGLMDFGHREDLGTTTLSSEDLLGFDCYLIFLRRKFAGSCTAVEYTTVQYFRDGTKIGEEQFVDRTCALGQKLLPDGHLVQGEDKFEYDFPHELFVAIVTPLMIQRRISLANQPPLRMPVSVTPTASASAKATADRGAPVAPPPGIAGL